MRFSPICWILLLMLVFVPRSAVQAGGGPESLLLVVNANSDASKTIANHYIRLRKLSPRNVLYLDWQGSTASVTGTEFRDQILKPILEAADQRNLGAQLEYIVYSADFPCRVDFRPEFKDEKLPKQFAPIASLTGATYLWTFSRDLQPGMVMPTINWYVPAEVRNNNQSQCKDCSSAPTRAFKARHLWLPSGESTTERDKGQAYFLSTMLGVTIEHGNSVAEVIDYLTRASVADASHPDGTFYFLENSNVRSKTRHGCYQDIVDQLVAEGAKAQVQKSTGPENNPDTLGIMAGTATFDIDPSKVSIIPGAICEHFTSYGGDFSLASQTKLSAWLRAGAAGSSGTVSEPFAIQAKFPLPVMQLHYRRGVSLGEAFYQSITGPYQLLIVGDALCQPWAKPPKVEVTSLGSGQTVRGTVPITVQVTPQPGTEVELCEIYIDGRLMGVFPPQIPFPLPSAKLAVGRHELRVVASTNDDIASRGRAIIPFYVAESPAIDQTDPAQEPVGSVERGSGSPVKLEVSPQPQVPSGSTLRVRVTGPADSPGFAILQNFRKVGYVQGSNGEVEIDTKLLGDGPVRLVAQESASEDAPLEAPESARRSSPRWILIR